MEEKKLFQENKLKKFNLKDFKKQLLEFIITFYLTKRKWMIWGLNQAILNRLKIYLNSLS